MTCDKPNHAHLCGEVTFGTRFGAIASVDPIAIAGADHDPHVHIRFCYGLSLDLTPGDAAELWRRIPEALAHLPLDGAQ